MIDHGTVPTHLAKVMQRLNVEGAEGSADTWMMTSYVAETFVKTLAIVLAAGIRKSSPVVAHKIGYLLARADGLGVWETVIKDCTGQAYAGYLDSDLQELVTWVIKKRTRGEDEWAQQTAKQLAQILDLLGMPETDLPRKLTVRFLLSQLVRVRNKTKAHGAVGADFFAKANTIYIDAIRSIIESCPIVRWEWLHLSVRQGKNTVRAVRLEGVDPKHLPAAQCESLVPEVDGLHFRSHNRGALFHCGDLVRCNRECSTFYVPNGSYTQAGVAEFLNYGSGAVEHVELPAYLQPPAPMPASVTEGQDELDIFSNVYGNLPQRQEGYVARPAIEHELDIRLRDKNHPILSLHGRGGIGKTSLALQAVHRLSDETSPLFEHILWMSARDLELKMSGATDVRRHVANLDAVCRLIGKMFDIDPTPEALALVLQDPQSIDSVGVLMVFDNFETLDDPKMVQRFLDTHTHAPNKVLITSRERSFKGDYPIEVGGMESDEATALLKQEAEALQIGRILTDAMVEEVFEYTDGHPYAMRVLLGETAKEERRIPLKSLVPRRMDLLSVVFERSFNRLSTEARWAFLCVTNFRSVIPELAMLVVLGLRDLDAELGLNECVRFSLLGRQELVDGEFAYSAPELARHFGKRKLEGDPDRLLIREDLQLLQGFGPIRKGQASDLSTDKLVARFVEHSKSRSRQHSCDQTAKEQLQEAVTSIAELHPAAWPLVAEFRTITGCPTEMIGQAWRWAVEEMPNDKDVWMSRARFEKDRGSNDAMISSMVSAVEADPTDVRLIRDVARELAKYLFERKHEIPATRRGVYLASVRTHMESVSGDLDATGLSRLAHLFLLEEDTAGAWKYANAGLERDPANTHCLKLVENLHNQGFVPLPD
jgi:hypothetical protein